MNTYQIFDISLDRINARAEQYHMNVKSKKALTFLVYFCLKNPLDSIIYTSQSPCVNRRLEVKQYNWFVDWNAGKVCVSP